MKKIDIFIPNYNRHKLLLKTIELHYLLLSKEFDLRFVIVDSSSVPLEIPTNLAKFTRYIHNEDAFLHEKPLIASPHLREGAVVIYSGNDDLLYLNKSDTDTFENGKDFFGVFNTIFVNILNDSSLGIWQGHSQQIFAASISNSLHRVKHTVDQGPILFYGAYGYALFVSSATLLDQLSRLIREEMPEAERLLEDIWNITHLLAPLSYLKSSYFVRGFHRYKNKNVSPDLRKIGKATFLSIDVYRKLLDNPSLFEKILSMLSAHYKRQYRINLSLDSVKLLIRAHCLGYAGANSRNWVLGRKYKWCRENSHLERLRYRIESITEPDAPTAFLPHAFFNGNWQPDLSEQFRLTEKWIVNANVQNLFAISGVEYWLSSRDTGLD